MGYGSPQRRRGQLGPLQHAGVNERLQALTGELSPEVLALPGDVVHAPNPSPGERIMVQQTLTALAARVEIVAVPGNHDRAFARDCANLGIHVTESW